MASGRSGGRSGGGSSSGGSSFSSSSRSGGGIHFGGGSAHINIGGGATSGFMGIIMGIIFIVFPSMFILFGIIQIVAATNIVKYDENEFQDYCYELYEETFGDYAADEDYFLLVLLVEDFSYYEYHYMAWTGNHLTTAATSILGGNNSTLGSSFNTYINESSYKYSLDTDIANTLNVVSHKLAQNGGNLYSCSESHEDFESRYDNFTNIQLNSSTLQPVIDNFEEETGVPIYLVIEDISDVFSKSIDLVSLGSGIAFVLVPGLFVISGIIAIITAVRGIKKRKNNASSNTTSSTGTSDEFTSMKDEIKDDFKIDPKEY